MVRNFKELKKKVQGLIVNVQTLRTSIQRSIDYLAELSTAQTAVERDFSEHLTAHSVVYQMLPGFESSVFVIDSQVWKARGYRSAALIALLIAAVFGGHFATATFETGSPFLMAIVIGVTAAIAAKLAAVAISEAAGASPTNPSRKYVVSNVLVGTFLVFLLASSAYLWVRWHPESILADYVSIKALAIEVSLVLFAGAAEVMYEIHVWSLRLTRRYTKLSAAISSEEANLSSQQAQLVDVEERLANYSRELAESDQQEDQVSPGFTTDDPGTDSSSPDGQSRNGLNHGKRVAGKRVTLNKSNSEASQLDHNRRISSIGRAAGADRSSHPPLKKTKKEKRR